MGKAYGRLHYRDGRMEERVKIFQTGKWSKYFYCLSLIFLHSK